MASIPAPRKPIEDSARWVPSEDWMDRMARAVLRVEHRQAQRLRSETLGESTTTDSKPS